jgi:hypothetical protein
MKIGELNTFIGQIVQNGCANFAAKRANVGISQIIRNNEKKIGTLSGFGFWCVSVDFGWSAGGCNACKPDHAHKLFELHFRPSFFCLLPNKAEKPFNATTLNGFFQQ